MTHIVPRVGGKKAGLAKSIVPTGIRQYLRSCMSEPARRSQAAQALPAPGPIRQVLVCMEVLVGPVAQWSAATV